MTAMDVKNQAFRRGFRGYERAQVDLFLRSAADEIERLNREHGEMLEETGRLRQDLEQMRAREQALQKTLVTAQRMSEELRERAIREGQLVVQEARQRAEMLIKDAQERLTRLELDISRSRLERETFERRLRGILEQHLALLEMRAEAREPDNLRMLPQRIGSEVG
jgi:cell division initiation protein